MAVIQLGPTCWLTTEKTNFNSTLFMNIFHILISLLRDKGHRCGRENENTHILIVNILTKGISNIKKVVIDISVLHILFASTTKITIH